jgi:DNA-directed RNA polymerase specialized sigma24 family protein
VLRLVAALAELPGLMREVIVLNYYQGWALTRVGRSALSVASLLRRALDDLRNRLRTEQS